MKVVLLLVAIYALIINQSLKQVNGKPLIQEAKKERKPNKSIHYIDGASISVTPFAIESDMRPASSDEKNPVLPAFLVQPDRSSPALYYKPQNAFSPISYPYQAISEKKDPDRSLDYRFAK